MKIVDVTFIVNSEENSIYNEKVYKINENYIGYMSRGDIWLDSITKKTKSKIIVDYEDNSFHTIRVSIDSPLKAIDFLDKSVISFLKYLVE